MKVWSCSRNRVFSDEYLLFSIVALDLSESTSGVMNLRLTVLYVRRSWWNYAYKKFLPTFHSTCYSVAESNPKDC